MWAVDEVGADGIDEHDDLLVMLLYHAARGFAREGMRDPESDSVAGASHVKWAVCGDADEPFGALHTPAFHGAEHQSQVEVDAGLGPTGQPECGIYHSREIGLVGHGSSSSTSSSSVCARRMLT
jgi:hypothetical protein